MTNPRTRAAVVIAALLAASTFSAPAPGSSATPEAAASARPTKRVCFPIPPEYPGCSKAQVRAAAQDDTDGWWRERRFGTTNNVLNSTNLTNAQIDKVMTATRENLRAMLNKDAASAVQVGKVASKASWTTSWRQNTYTLDSFPYVAWTNQMFQGCDTITVNGVCPGNLNACFDDIGNTTNGWAYLECSSSGVPNGWATYWQDYYEWVNNPGAQGDTVCKREIFVAATTGGTGGAIGGAFAGPGAALGGALAAAATGTVTAIVSCAANALADQWGWD